MQGRLWQAQADNWHAGPGRGIKPGPAGALGWTLAKEKATIGAFSFARGRPYANRLCSAAITVKSRHRAAILGNSKKPAQWQWPPYACTVQPEYARGIPRRQELSDSAVIGKPN